MRHLRPVFKRGVVPIVVIIIVLVASSAVAIYFLRNYKKSQAILNSPTPLGTVTAAPNTVFEYGVKDASITLTSTNVIGTNGTQVDNVRYFLLNPALASGNTWGNPDWCSAGDPCTQTTSGMVTYDISQSSNPGDNYKIVWDPQTHSSGSTPYDRALKLSNIPPGKYTVGLRVEDVNGNVNGMASSAEIILTQSKTPPPIVPTPSPGPTTYQYLIRIANTEITPDCCIQANPQGPDLRNRVSFTLKTSPDPRGYTAFVCTPDCSIISRGLDLGLTRYNVQFYPNIIGGNIILNNNRPPDDLTLHSDFDTFNDGFELYMGTDPRDACPNTTQHAAWPPDINNDRAVNIPNDILGVAKKIGTNDKRYDLNADGAVTNTDVQIVAGYFGKTCTN